jgi:hypothetical protein
MIKSGRPLDHRSRGSVLFEFEGLYERQPI